MPDLGFTHVALPVTDLDASIAFYAKYAGMQVVHRRAQASNPEMEIAWLSDRTRLFAIVLAEATKVEYPLGPFAHLGVACTSREEIDRLCAEARVDKLLRKEPRHMGEPAGYLAFISDPDGHTLELSYGQEVKLAVERPGD